MTIKKYLASIAIVVFGLMILLVPMCGVANGNFDRYDAKVGVSQLARSNLSWTPNDMVWLGPESFSKGFKNYYFTFIDKEGGKRYDFILVQFCPKHKRYHVALVVGDNLYLPLKDFNTLEQAKQFAEDYTWVVYNQTKPGRDA